LASIVQAPRLARETGPTSVAIFAPIPLDRIPSAKGTHGKPILAKYSTFINNEESDDVIPSNATKTIITMVRLSIDTSHGFRTSVSLCSTRFGNVVGIYPSGVKFALAIGKLTFGVV
jgi:hypothetical protein